MAPRIAARRSGNGDRRAPPVAWFYCAPLAWFCSAVDIGQRDLLVGRVLDELNFYWFEEPIPDRQFGNLCRALERPDLPRDPRFLHRMDRWRNRTALIGLLEAIFAADTVQAWCDRLQPQGVICAPVYNLKQTFEDPQVIHRDVAMTLRRPGYPPTRLLRNPIRFSETPIEAYGFPPELGEHTEAVLSAILGYPPGKIQALRDAAVI